MPSRVIRGEINSSRSLSRVSLEADLTFRALLVAVDDFGRAEADPLMLKAMLFPRRPDVSPEDVRRWVEELHHEGCVRIYRVDGVEYLQLTAWEKHRARGRRASKSRFPDPPDPRNGSEVLEAPGNEEEIECEASGFLGFPRKSEEATGFPLPGRGTRDEGRGTFDEGRGTRDEGGVWGGRPDPAPPEPEPPQPETPSPDGSGQKPPKPKRARPKTAPPERLDRDQLASLRAWAERHHNPAIQRLAPRVRDLAEACLDWHRSKGNRHADWVATCRTWIRRTASLAPPGRAPGPANRARASPRGRVSGVSIHELWREKLEASEGQSEHEEIEEAT